MSDILLQYDDNGNLDIVIENGRIKTTDGAEGILYTSLLTDARASESQVQTPEYRRGWMGDIVSPVEDRTLGSLLWLVDQSRLTQGNLNKAVSLARSSLNWLIEDNILKSVEVKGSIIPRTGIELEITCVSFNGTTNTQYVELWERTGE